MAFSLGSLFGSSSSADKAGGYQAFKRYSNKELQQLSKKKLDRFERAKFDETMAGKIKLGREMSADEIIKTVGRDHNFRFKSTIKKKLFTQAPHEGLTDEQIKRNLLLAQYDRLNAEAETDRSRSQHQASEYHSATAPAEAPRSSFFKPGSTEPETHKDHPANQPLARPPV